jgi:hypothetical protein
MFKTFRYRATDSFTKEHTGNDFFSERIEKSRVDSQAKNLRKELEGRVGALREILKGYGNVIEGFRISLIPGRGSYEETEKSCCYTSDVLAECEALRGTQLKLSLR